MSERRRRGLGAGGLFIALLGVYLLTAPGRIDILDGQFRYEAAKNWLDRGEPVVTDPYLQQVPLRLVNQRTRKTYAVYNAAPSITPMPLMLLARFLPGQRVERDHFAFSLAGPVFGALLGALLVWGYGLFGIGLRESVFYTALFCLATLWWPSSVTVFDQNQHATFLYGAVLLAWLAGRRQSVRLAALAGLLGGLLINYQEVYALLLPAVGLAVFASAQEGEPGERPMPPVRPDRAALWRYIAFGLSCCVGLGLFFAYNQLRLGSPVLLSKYAGVPTVQRLTWGNPLAAFLSLALSPGKGILWFSPPLILAILGARRLRARAPVLALTVAVVSAVHFLVIIQLPFFGGDWCWGPRYAIPVMPLWALAIPFAPPLRIRPRRLVASLAAVGVLVQVLGISLETQRFFWEQRVPYDFLMKNPWSYFTYSQLKARPFEILDTLEHGLPREAQYFTPAPEQTTSALGLPRTIKTASRWMRGFAIFYLPRPWWGWVGRIRPAERPADPSSLAIACGLLLGFGALLLRKPLRADQLAAEPDAMEPSRMPVPRAGELRSTIGCASHD